MDKDFIFKMNEDENGSGFNLSILASQDADDDVVHLLSYLLTGR